MKTIYVFFSLLITGVLTSCTGNDTKQPTVTETHAVHHPDTMPVDNTAVADSANGNANVRLGGQ